MNMRNLFFSTLLLISFASCKSDFERIRTSSNVEAIYEAADAYVEAEEYNKAILLYEMIIPSYRGKSEAEDLNYKFAETHFKNGNYVLSSHYFKTFADTYTSSPKREEALFRNAYSEYRQAPFIELDQTNSNAAIEAFQLFVNSFPESEKVNEANKYMDELRAKLEEKAFKSGELYYNLKNYNSAIQTLENMLKDFPGSKLSEEAYFLIAKASHEWADKSIYTRQEERFNKTMKRCDLFLKKFPGSEYGEKIEDYKIKCQKAINSLTNG